MEDQKQHVVDALKQATNILVTVKSNPNLDQLSACIALTLMLNGLGKHATAVFSGIVPSVLEFLEPEKTIQTNTDSLQDFIISLDKAKADKLRYKVEDTVVKIFITPYRTSLSEKDLEFGQGDFNVDVVVALGVHSQDDIDQAITVHGRILHDATVVSVNTEPGVADDLGSLNWINADVSSLSELIANTSDELLDGKSELFDNQVATALLTGIVAETERFGNAKTKPATMQTAAKLLQAGANQELVATKLTESHPAPPPVPEAEPTVYAEPAADKNDHDDTPPSPSSEAPGVHTNPDGSLSISHRGDMPEPEQPSAEPAFEPPATPNEAEPAISDVHASEIPRVPDLSSPLAAVPDPHDAPPQTYDPNQISVPASIPTSMEFGQGSVPPADPPPPAPEDSQQMAEELAVLDMLKQNQAIDQERKTIQPLRDQNGFLGEPPLHEKKINPAGANGQPVDESLDPTKFAITPPTMGGTLTAAHESDIPDAAGDPLEPLSTPQQPMLSHNVRSIVPSPSASEGSVPPITPPEVGPPDVHDKTLAELEVEMHSPHVATAQQGTASPETGLDSDAARQALDAVMAAHDDVNGPQSAVANAQHLDLPTDSTLDMPAPSAVPLAASPNEAMASADRQLSAPPPSPPPFPVPARSVS